MKNSFLLFFLSPFLGFIQAFKHYKESWAKNSVLLFVVFYGFTFDKPEAMDCSRYVIQLQELYNSPVSWDSFSKTFFADEDGQTDIYQASVTFFLSLFTNNGNILFAVFGMVFGYFYSRNIWFLFEQNKGNAMDIKLWLLLFSFICIIGFWTLGGVRMWTASHVFYYGVFTYIIKENKKGLLIASSSFLIHFSFLLPVAILGLYVVLKLSWKILYFVYLASFSVSELNMSTVSEKLTSILPSFVLPKVNGYTSEVYGEVVKMGPVNNWYIIYSNKSINWAILIMVSIIYYLNKSNKENKSFSNLFSFTLLFLSVGNIMSLIPSAGRYIYIANLFALTVMILFYIQNNNKLFSRGINFVTPLLVFFIVISIWKSFQTITLETILMNPIISLFLDLPIPLNTLIK